jgi:poly(hydroxyalkanoate) depolymerase family esterase
MHLGRQSSIHTPRSFVVARSVGVAAGAAAFGLLVSSPAQAATLTGPITGWSQGNVPNYVSMYEYVPNTLAANPPILVVSHYCGGNAAGVFGEAQGGGIVAAADQYGFIMIFPQTSNNCWDVGTTKSLTHNGGGDTQAVAEMVTYVISKYNADAARVYATGTSSGAMMTEALLAVYPDVFKAGAEFSGVPAGCWSVNNPNGQWSAPCAMGQVTHTAQQWGDMVRAMYAGYTGYRPRIQLWHGTADATINYNNQTEAIKEWTNVLGLSTNPTSTQSVMFANHQWTHDSWQNSCGFTVLDAWSEQNGPHGTDANLNAAHVIPFLGLDKTGPTDPEVAQCGSSSSSSTSSSSTTSSSSSSTSSSSTSSSSTSSSSTSSSGSSTSSGSSSASSSTSSGSSSTSSGSSTGSGSSSTSSGGNTSGSSSTSSGAGGSNGSGGASSSTGSASGNGTGGGHGAGTPSSSPGCSCDLARESGSEGAFMVVGVVALGAAFSRRSTRRGRASA